jgi:hypothetical protein
VGWDWVHSVHRPLTGLLFLHGVSSLIRSVGLLVLSIYGSTALVKLDRFFSFLIYTQSVGHLGRRISTSQGRYLHTEQHKNRTKAHRHPCLELDSNPRPKCSADEDGSCLRPRGHCVRPISPICLNYFLLRRAPLMDVNMWILLFA